MKLDKKVEERMVGEFLKRIFPEKYSGLVPIEPENFSPDLIDNNKKIGVEVTLGLPSENALKKLYESHANEIKGCFDESMNYFLKPTKIHGINKTNFNINIAQDKKDEKYNKLDIYFKKNLKQVNVENDKVYAEVYDMNIDYDISTILGKYVKLNSSHSSYKDNLIEINLFVRPYIYYYGELEDIIELSNKLKKVLNCLNFEKKFKFIYISVPETLFIIDTNNDFNVKKKQYL